MPAALAMWLAAGAAAAQAPRAGAPAAPPALESATRDSVAARWRIDPERVWLAWGPVAVGAPLPAGAPPRLSGGSADGWWTVALPGGRTARVRVGVETQVPAAARDLPRGAVLAAEDIAPGSAVRWGPPTSAASASANGVRPGWTTRRVVAAGEPLVPPAVAPPELVTARGSVRVHAVRGGVRLELRGVALESGRLGERVRVRLGPGWQVEGTVTGEASVRAGDAEESSR